MRKDRSARTRVVGHWNIAFIVACSMLLVGLCGLAWGCSTYQGMRSRSSSPRMAVRGRKVARPARAFFR